MCQILCEPQRPLRSKNKDKIQKIQTAESAEERRGWINVSDTLRTSASSAVQEQRQNSKNSNRRERGGAQRMDKWVMNYLTVDNK